MKIIDTWFGMEGDIDGNPYIIRGREDLKAFQKSGLYQTRIDICLTYVAQDESNMPDNNQLELMEEVEELLIEQLEHDLEGNFSHLSLQAILKEFGICIVKIRK